MSRGRLIKAAILCCALALPVAAADAALVRVNGITLVTDGGFEPRTLPRHRFAPIDFEGFANITARGGAQPPPLAQVVVDFDRDGRLSAGGLPVCPPERVANSSPSEARKACAGAIVGTGKIEALIGLASGPVPASSPLTIFNGPRQSGEPSVILHARTTVPAIQTFAVLVPIEKRPGAFRYRTTFDVPPIAAGLGSITSIEIDVGRRFSVDGKQRSYVSAHCSDGILHTHGRFTFAEGTIIDGSVEKACTAK